MGPAAERTMSCETSWSVLKKLLLLMSLSVVLTTSFLIAAFPTASFGGMRWGLYDVEFTAETQDQIVAARGARKGFAMQLGGSMPRNDVTFTAAGAPRENKARLATIRARVGGGCEGPKSQRPGPTALSAFVALEVDGRSLGTALIIPSATFSNYSFVLPQGIDITSEVHHTWKITFLNPGIVKTCNRFVQVDLGGWETVGALDASQLHEDSNPENVVGDSDDELGSWKRISGTGSVSGTPDVSWGSSLHVYLRRIQTCYLYAPKVEVSINGVPIASRSISSAFESRHFRRMVFVIPLTMRSDELQEVTVRFISSEAAVKANKNCNQAIDVSAVRGNATISE